MLRVISLFIGVPDVLHNLCPSSYPDDVVRECEQVDISTLLLLLFKFLRYHYVTLILFFRY